MLDMIDYEKIRSLHNDAGWSIRKLSRELGHCRKTIRKVLNEWDGEPPRYKMEKGRPAPVITPRVREFVWQILVSDKQAPRKQRHSALRIFKRLKAELKFEGGKSTVRRLVRELRAKLRETKGVTTPLAFKPGEEIQVDWGYAKVKLAGVEVEVCLLLMTLCYSRRTFVRAFAAENQQCFLEGLLEGFEYFGGVSLRCAFDNLKAAVHKVFIGSKREENEDFKRFRVYHGFEPRYCTPGKDGAHEKGRVERRVDLFRSAHLTPVPEVESWEELNGIILAGCEEEDLKPHPGDPDVAVLEAFEEESLSLKPLPRHRYRCCKYDTAKADGHARVRFDTVLYSLPCKYGRRRVELRAYHDRIEFFDGVSLIRTWERSYQPREEKYDYRHYIPLLAKAPGATLNGKPYDFMPEVLKRYRSDLIDHLGRREAARSLAKVLRLILDHPEDDVLEAVELALLCGTTDPDAVKNLVLQMQGEWTRMARPLDLSSHASEVSELEIEHHALEQYDQLMEMYQ
jgi:transposase